ANVCLSIESYVAQLPPWAVLTLYQSHVDPHLIYGYEVVLDARKRSPTLLIRVQHTYLPRVVGLTSRSRTAVLFTETGVWPLAYRRISLALRYVVYLLNSRHTLPLAALADSRSTALMGEGSWFGDLRLALRRLPVAVTVDFDLATLLSLKYIHDTAKRVQLSLSTHLMQEMRYKEGLPLLRVRLMSHQNLARREYLAVPNKHDRLALCHLFSGDSPLAIVQLRRRGSGVQRNRRTCRFCSGLSTVKDEIHVLLECTAQQLVGLREEFLHDLYLADRRPRHTRATTSAAYFVVEVARECATATVLAKFVRALFALCAEVSMLEVELGEVDRAVAPESP
ncbi:hypothetical protein FOMPIDRAFT_1136852, partial [Fomitopsis schrenkii]